ncbi:DNA excision repair protein ERCC-6-like [Borealophlyctis nickersoniae]|nr:DNA excision repair protein ERCC-6-like [Borealophlyctis nickersoniae]
MDRVEGRLSENSVDGVLHGTSQENHLTEDVKENMENEGLGGVTTHQLKETEALSDRSSTRRDASHTQTPTPFSSPGEGRRTPKPNRPSPSPAIDSLTASFHDIRITEASAAQPEPTAEVSALIQRAKELEKSYFYAKALKMYKKIAVMPGLGRVERKVDAKIRKLEDIVEKVKANDGWYPNGPTGFHELAGGYKLPSDTYTKMFPHQHEGVKWMWKLFGDDQMGGILGDDMGMGKTIQVICFLMGLFASGLCRHVLIAMPLGLLETWKTEFKNWYPQMRVFHGPSNLIHKALRVVLDMGGVVLTTYDKIRTSQESLTDGGNHTWDYIILDEGHTIKNPTSKKSLALRKVPAKHKLLLSGTPLQNNMGELWALFDYVCNGNLLSTKRNFTINFANPIAKGEARDSTLQEKQIANKVAEALRSLIGPYFLRREKSLLTQDTRNNTPNEDSVDNAGTQEEVQEPNEVKPQSGPPHVGALGRKNEVAVWVPMRRAQEDLYSAFLNQSDITEPIMHMGSKQILNKTRSPLSSLGTLKKICDSPALLSKELQDCKSLDLGAIAPPTGDPDFLVDQSSKLLVTMNLLDMLTRQGHRTLVFSSSRMMLDIIDRCIRAKGMKLLRIDGTVIDRKERQKRINLFNKDTSYSCFLLTTQVGIGITLTGADREFKLADDPSWNPKKDAQAVDRAYRVGQTRDVVVYRLITCGTLEEKIYRNQVRKDFLSRTATDTKSHVRYFKQAELKDMFTLGDTRVSRTMQYLTRQHPIESGCDPAVAQHYKQVAELNGVGGLSHHDQLYSMTESIDDWDDDAGETAKEIANEFLRSIENQPPASPPRPRNRSKKKDSGGDVGETTKPRRVRSKKEGRKEESFAVEEAYDLESPERPYEIYEDTVEEDRSFLGEDTQEPDADRQGDYGMEEQLDDTMDAASEPCESPAQKGHPTSACPSGDHQSTVFQIHHCRCMWSDDEGDEYDRLLFKFRRRMSEHNLASAFQALLKALEICDDDARCHWWLHKLGELVL